MPIIKSAKKRVRVAQKATIRNVKTKRNLREAVKAFQAAVTGKSKDAHEAHRKAQSAIGKAGKKNVMHKNKVARKQRQLAAAAKAAGVKPSAAVKKAAPKTAAKPVTKKAAPAKKATIAKKLAAKKTTKQ
jgi:small subunit ribosomal protein S20